MTALANAPRKGLDPVLRWGIQVPRQRVRLLIDQAGLGNSEAQAQLGQALLDGHGITRDQALALRWFAIAAAAGHLQGLNMLGRCHELGWGCTADAAAAARCYRLAAERGLDWAQYNYANLLSQGRGVARDMARALQFYQLAADAGHAKAMNLVGRFHEEGWVGAVDLHAASYWFQRSALAGDFRGQCSYAATLTRAGKYAEAAGWIVKASRTATPAFLLKIHAMLSELPWPEFAAARHAIEARCRLNS